VPCIVVLNKTDLAGKEAVQAATQFFLTRDYCKSVIAISALKQEGLNALLTEIMKYLPEGEPFFNDDDLSDLPTKFFVSEIIREKIFELFQEELPYHTAVLVQEFKEKESLIKIRADIIVQRETQKMIVIGSGGSMIKKLGTMARMELEQFLDRKVFLELFVKVRPHWRDNERHLREYGY
jgi:GTP-binding protein Era